MSYKNEIVNFPTQSGGSGTFDQNAPANEKLYLTL